MTGFALVVLLVVITAIAVVAVWIYVLKKLPMNGSRSEVSEAVQRFDALSREVEVTIEKTITRTTVQSELERLGGRRRRA